MKCRYVGDKYMCFLTANNGTTEATSPSYDVDVESC
jgi:hypothetical protein